MMPEANHEETHASPRYGLVLLGLVLLTAVEVAVSYLTGGIKIGILLLLAVFKAALVILYFMHLKFDARIYAFLFALGLILVIPLLAFIMLATP